jgi:hypothetical protein
MLCAHADTGIALPRPSSSHRLHLRQIADYLDVTPQRVHQLSRRPDFPRPAVVAFDPPVWDAAEIAA